MTLPEGLLGLENRPTSVLRPPFPGRNKDVTDNGEDPSGKGSPAAHNCLNKFSGEVRGRPQIQPRPERGSWSKELGLAPTRAAELEGTGVPPTPLGAHTLRAHTVASRHPGRVPAQPRAARTPSRPGQGLRGARGPRALGSPKGAPDTSPGGRPSKPAAPGAHPGTRRGQARAPETLRASQPRGGGGVGVGGASRRASPPFFQSSRHPGPRLRRGLDNSSEPPECPGSPLSRSHPSRAVTSAREASELHSPGLPAPSSGGRSAGPLRRARGSSEGGREGGSWAGG